MGDQLQWRIATSGTWEIAANWIDLTTNSDPSAIAPDASNSASIAGPSGSVAVITGPASSLALLTTGQIAFEGQFTTGSLMVGMMATLAAMGTLGVLDLFAGTSLTVSGDASVVSPGFEGSGSTLKDDGATLSIAGMLMLGTSPVFPNMGSSGNLWVVDHGTAEIGNVDAYNSFGGSSIFLDSTSILEIGTGGSAVAGTLTVDSGAAIWGSAVINAPAVLNNGTISGALSLTNVTNNGSISDSTVLSGTNNGSISDSTVLSGTNNGVITGGAVGTSDGQLANNGTILTGIDNAMRVAGISGSGQIEIDHNGTLSLGSGVTEQIDFLDNSGVLNVTFPDTTPANTPPIAGFTAGDKIIIPNAASIANYTSTGPGIGNLVLSNSGGTVATLTLLGDYTNAVFIPTASGGSTSIGLAQGSVGAGTNPPSQGTTNPDAYAWIATAGGDWGQAANWLDVTANTLPAAIAPGHNNAVSIAGSANSFQVISGQGSAASLATTGDVVLSGLFTTGTLTVGTKTTLANIGAVGVLDLFAGTSLTVSGDASVVSLAGGGGSTLEDDGATLSVAGMLTLGAPPVFPFPAMGSSGTLSVVNHGTAEIGSVDADKSFGDSAIFLDSTSILEIGTGGSAVAGTLTVDSGAAIWGSAVINAPAVLNNGAISGASSLANVTNNGSISDSFVLSGTNNGVITGGAVGTSDGQLVNNGTILTESGNAMRVADISGSGQIEIDHDGTLSLGSGVTGQIDFLDNSGVLNVTFPDATPANTPPIAGFTAGDKIIIPNAASIANYTSTGPGTGNLVLSNTGGTAAVLPLLGDYTNAVFIPTTSGGSTSIGLAQGSVGAGTNPPSQGTTNPDAYAWIATAGGDWGQAANWLDVTANTLPAAIAPGHNNAVSIAGSTSSFQVISGQGSAASLVTTGDVVLSGLFTTGALTVGTMTTMGNIGAVGVLDLFAGTSLTVGGDASVVSLAGGGGSTLEDDGATLSIAGVLTLGAPPAFPFPAMGSSGTLSVVNHGTAEIGSVDADNSAGGSAGDSAIFLDSTSILEIGTGGSAVAGTLTVDSGAAIWSSAVINAPAVLNNGTISGALSLTNVTNNGSISYSTVLSGTNNGVITGGVVGAGGQAALVNNGTILTGSDNAMSVAGISGSGQIEIDHDGTLSLGSGVTGQIDFLDNSGVLNVTFPDGTQANTPPIAGFTTGDIITIPYATTPNAASIANYTSTGPGTGNLVLSNSSSTIATLTLLGDYTNAVFIPTASGGSVSISMQQVTCFVAGTRISTVRGEVAIEDLQVGDCVRILGGESPQPIIWIGQRQIDCERHPEPSKVWPVRISAHAFGLGRPSRDLYLSPNHAVYVQDVLIPVKCLINGTSIVQVPRNHTTYYHLELEEHAIIFAEDLATETYLDTGDRSNFDQQGDVVRLFPDFSLVTKNAALIWEARGFAPLIVCGPELGSVRRWLASMRGAEFGPTGPITNGRKAL